MKKVLSLLILSLMMSACTSGNVYRPAVETSYEKEWQPIGTNR